MPNIFFTRFKPYIALTRIASPTGYLLCYFPATYGLLLANSSKNNIYYIILFFIGSILVRSAGCIINDLMDRDFDLHVERTKNRPLASRILNIRQALCLLIIFSLLSFGMLLTLSRTAIYLGFIAVGLTIIYPLAKRYTYYPQILLGFVFNMGCLIGYATHTNQLSLRVIILYSACICWTIAFDSIYAFMDIDDDKKIGIKSIAIILEKLPYKIILTMLYLIFFLCFFGVFASNLGFIGILCILIAINIAIWSIKTLNITEPSNCLLRFKINNLIGFILFLGIFLEKL
ncbi:MAG: 4-hydroxybenzoate octaprenyltransferase [Rickettsiaceae bacterium]|nr:4-hydroxybenzoate octaprenyltransferase [Rickettsiaceae bacterium]